MAVTEDHAAVEAEITGRAGRNDLDLCGEEILLLNIIFLLEDLEHICLDGFLVLAFEGTAADNHVELLAFDNDGTLLAELVACKVNEQIGDTDNGVGEVFTDNDIDEGTVLLCNYAVQRKGNGDPLVLLDTAVVVGIEICNVGILIHGILLEVHAGGVDMCADDIDALFKGLLTHLEEHDGFTHGVEIYAIAALELAALGDYLIHIAIALCFRHFDGVGDAFALGLAVVKILTVLAANRIQLFIFSSIIGFPCIFSFHI